MFGKALVGHIPRSSLGADEYITIRRLKSNVLHIRANPTVGLSKHGLRPESSSYQEDIFPFQATTKKKIYMCMQSVVDSLASVISER